MVVPDLGNYRECCSRWFTYGSAAPIADPIGSHYQLFKTESMGSLPNCAFPRFKYLDHMRRYHANSALVRLFDTPPLGNGFSCSKMGPCADSGHRIEVTLKFGLDVTRCLRRRWYL
jgi:hypothetical protein